MRDRDEWLAFLRQRPQGEGLTESPIELALHRTLFKYLAIGGRTNNVSGFLYPQVPLSTRAGLFRADFLLVAGEQITLVECDGASFHADPFDDHLRSAFVLEAGLADQVIRFNGSMLHHSPYDAALWTAAVAPEAFWGGAEASIARVATPEAVAALEEHRGELQAGYSNFHYSALTEDTEDSGRWEDGMRYSGFQGTFHTATPGRSRVRELIATLARTQASTIEDLEREYWAEVKAKSEEVSDRFWAGARRREDAESGPFTREGFDKYWLLLVDRFQPQRPKASPEVYFAALSTFRYASQMERAFKHIIRYAQYFPTPQELRDAASAKPNEGSLW